MLEVIREYILETKKSSGKYIDAGYIEDNIYINLYADDDQTFNEDDDQFIWSVAKHCEELINESSFKGNEKWVLYSEPNYWDRNGGEVDYIDEADTIQYMLYLEDKQ